MKSGAKGVMEEKENRKLRRRILVTGLFFSLLYTAVIARAVHVHVFKGPWLSEKAEGQYAKTYTLKGKRGTIFDRNFHEMAVSIDTDSICAYPYKIKDKKQAAAQLAGPTKLRVEELYTRLNSKNSFVWIKRLVEPEAVEKVRALGINGIDFIPENSRFYPNRRLASQVLGFTGMDGNGLEGVEFSYNHHLDGREAKQKVIQDAKGKGIGLRKGVLDAYSGENLVLTIDRTIQYSAEEHLAKAVTDHRALSGMAVVMDPKSGALLALAHYPFFNPNTYRQYTRNVWRNRAITDPFEPGSTMKVFLASGAIESGMIDKNTKYNCENGKYRVGPKVFNDTHSYGELTIPEIVKYSSNIGSVKIAETIGRENVYATLRGFGFGSKTGIDCPGETPGMLMHYRRWTKVDAGAIAFGQGVAVSAVQITSAISAIANGGMLMKPYVVKAITDHNGRLVKKFDPQPVGRAISANTAALIKGMMRGVVLEGGTGTQAALDGYGVCGKTGTAQKVSSSGGYARGRYVASFIGFVPEEDPVLTILVLLDEPRGSYYGGVVAAPAFREIARESLLYLNVPPSAVQSPDAPGDKSVSAPPANAADRIMKKKAV